MNPSPPTAEPFSTLQQQRTAMVQGMWIFLAAELLLFAGGFLAYLIYRIHYADAFAGASSRLDLLLGTLNTAILLTSSLGMALADHAAGLSRRRAVIGFLLLTAALGCTFLIIKGIEYHHEYQEGLIPFLSQPFQYQGPAPEHARLFFNLYFIMTGMHAVHLMVGIGLVTVLTLQVWFNEPDDSMVSRLKVGALYWHFIDVIWVFLFPMYYLVR